REGSRQAREARQARYRKVSRNLPASAGRALQAEDDEDRYEEVAEELRDLISDIDKTALADNGFWETFCDDVAIGDYADWDA
ncbi:hypothetical protein ACWEO4_46845, partial [Streptomyces sp. NPDC004393]